MDHHGGNAGWFRPKILVVDDDEQFLDFLGEALHSMGAEPQCMVSAVEAAQAIEHEKFDGIFLDWLLPEIDGLELARRVRWSKSNSRCPVVMITAVADPSGLKESFRAGINFFLQKPISQQQVENLFSATRGLMLHERLRYQRADVAVPVAASWLVQDFTQKATGESRNISATGMLVRLNASPPPLASVELQFTLPGTREKLAMEAYVVRTTRDGCVGLRFADVPAEIRHQIMDFTEKSLEGTQLKVRAGAASHPA